MDPFVPRCPHCGSARDPKALRDLDCHALVCAACGCVPDPLVWTQEVFDLLGRARQALFDAEWAGEAKFLRTALRGTSWLRRVYHLCRDHRGVDHATTRAVRALAEAMGEDPNLPYATAYPQAAGDGP